MRIFARSASGAIARYDVGAVKHTVAPNCAIASSSASGAGFSSSTVDAPARSGNSSAPPRPYVNASGGVPTNTSSGVGANDDGGNVSQIASTSRWKCIVPFGRPVVPDVNAIMQTSSEAVSTLSNVSRCFFIRADKLSGRSSCESTTVVSVGHDGRAASSSSISRASQIACVISAAVMTSTSSLARSSGIVVTTTQPAFTTPSQHAAITSLLKPRSSTRLPGTSPRSLSSTFAMRFASASNSA